MSCGIVYSTPNRVGALPEGILETTKVPIDLYVLKTELEAKHYLTSTDLQDYALKANIPIALSQLNDDSTHRLVTDTEKATWNSKSNFSGNYNDLDQKPTVVIGDKTYTVNVKNSAPASGTSENVITFVY